MGQIQRRRFLIGGSALLAAQLARAQQWRREQQFHISGTSEWITPEYRARFVAKMQARGWQESRDYSLTNSGLPYGAPVEESARLALASKPDLVIVINTSYALAVQRLTRTIPIIMWTSGFPVEAGVADSLARPGRNVTGNTIYAGVEFWPKVLQLLRDAKPGMKRISVLWDYLPPDHPPSEVVPMKAELHRGGSALGLDLSVFDVPTSANLQHALSVVEAARPEGLAFTSGRALWGTREEIVSFATQRRLPTVTEFSTPPEDTRTAPLLVYSPDLVELENHAVDYVDRIMRGAKPGELPIRQPAKFELVVSARMARAIGLVLPRSLLVSAHRVIE